MRPHSLAMFLTLTLLPAATAPAQQRQPNPTSALINEALDKNVTLTLNDVLPAVLKTIEEKTGVRISASDSVYELLPWGEQTNIKATVENQTLRAALTAIAQKLGLTWELGPFEVVLKPMPALQRLGRRATLTEIQALELLRTTPFAKAQPQMSTGDLLHSIDDQLAKIKKPAVALDIRTGDPADPQSGFIPLDKPVNIPRDSHLAVVLEDLARQSNATWYPWGTKVVIVPKQQYVRMQLDKSITARFNGTDIARVLDQLSAETGVPFQIEPGAFQRVPPQYRNIRLDLTNATVRQILEDIRGVTGLDYVVKGEGVYVWNQNPPSTTPTAPAPGATDPVIAFVQAAPDTQLMLRESDLPPDVRAFLSQKRQEAIQSIRDRMKQEHFTPGTPPTTQPTR
jgi:hypothetical protein